MSVYESTFLSPYNVAINADENNTLQATVQGSGIVSYRIRIYDMSDDSLDLDTGDIVVSDLETGDKISYELLALTLVNGGLYKWNIETSDGTDSVISPFAVFKTNSAPIITFAPPTTITAQSYEFTATYSQAENVGVDYYQFVFYDINDIEVLTTDNTYSGKIKYTFEGFTNSRTYKVKIVGYTKNGVYWETAVNTFLVEYGQPNIFIEPEVTLDTETSLVTATVGEVNQISGIGSGSYSFVDGGIFPDNVALRLPTVSDTATFDVDFTNNFTLKGDFKCDGTAKELCYVNGSSNAILGYDGDKFYYTINSVTFQSVSVNPTEFASGGKFYILRTKVVIKTSVADYTITVFI